MTPFIYIVGGGTFAIKTASILEQQQIDYAFVDEFATSPFMGKALYTCDSIPNVEHICLIAMSDMQHAQNATERLLIKNIPRQLITSLLYESALSVLSEMLSQDKQSCLALLRGPETDFAVIETRFFEHNLSRDTHSDKINLGFYYIGQGGGFRSHVIDLPSQLEGEYRVKEFSDQAPTRSSIENCRDDYHIMSEQRMLQNNWPDIVINPHFFACSPPNIKKVTMMHMVYDFLVYKDLVARVMEQADTHYLFIPSKPSMLMHQQICRDYLLKNNMVLIPGGYPRLDQNKKRYEIIKQQHAIEDVIVYAPTLSALMASQETQYTYSIFDAIEFIPAILAKFSNKQVIFRPHPDDLVVVKQGVNTLRADAFRFLLNLCEEHPRCHLDDGSEHYLETFARAQLIISDTSAIAYTFALITRKPVIFYSADQKMVQQVLPNLAYIKDREKVGFCVDKLDTLLEKIAICLDGGFAQEKVEFCNQLLYQNGTSVEYFKEALKYIAQDKKHPEWWYWQDNC